MSNITTYLEKLTAAEAKGWQVIDKDVQASDGSGIVSRWVLVDPEGKGHGFVDKFIGHGGMVLMCVPDLDAEAWKAVPE